MNITRRSAISGFIASACCPVFARALDEPEAAVPVVLPSPAPGWTAAWDRKLLNGLMQRMNSAYDPAARMSRAYRGPEYNYQSNLRSTTVHPIKDSFDYALALLEVDTPELRARAIQILERVIALQDADPASKWFGVWSYYLEEPLKQMSTVDFNWADFNGSTLLLILYRHGDKLPASVLNSVHEAILRASASIRRRDITPYYTNIIAQGSSVVLAAAECMQDADLLEYGVGRMRKWAALVDQSGSFAEYNSPAYTPQVIEHMTRIRMFVRNPEARMLADRLHHRAWQHFAAHWHAPTMQLAGPMARAYSNDVGSPLWLQKGIGNAVLFENFEALGERGGALTAALLDFDCPAEMRSSFVRLDHRHQHREIFIAGNILLNTLVPRPCAATLIPVEGTTLMTPSFALGSANRSDFWVQRRPLLAFWGDARRPPSVMQLRVIKNDYDFTSASFYSVQQGGAVLGAIGFRTDGGDKHPLIDVIKGGTFSLQQMFAQFLFPNWNPAWQVLMDGKPFSGKAIDIPLNTRISMDVGACRIGIQIRAAAFVLRTSVPDAAQPSLRWSQSDGKATLELTLYKKTEAAPFHWADLQDAGAAFTCIFDDSSTSLSKFDRDFKASTFNTSATTDRLRYIWAPPVAAGAESLELTVHRGAGAFAEMETAYMGRIDGKPAPMERLDSHTILNA